MLEEIKLIKKRTKEIVKSKKSALKYLKDSGILKFVEENEKSEHK